MAIDKILRLDGASITWTYKQVAKMMDNGKVSFRNVVQRSFVWDRKRMSELIWSIIMNFPVPPIYSERGDTENEKVKIFDVLDGQQRCTSVYKYLNDEFTLTELKPIPYLDENGIECELDISGLKFSELDEELQDTIKDATITVKYFDNLNQKNKSEMFRRLNNGKPLSAKSRTLASAKNINELLNIGSHQLFDEMLTDKARANKNQAVITVKAWIMLNENIDDISFASKDLNPFIENIDMTDTEKLELNNMFDYIVNVHNELKDNHEKDVAKKLYTETHFISLIPFAKKALENNINESMFSEWLINFFKTENNSNEYAKYMEASRHGITKNINVIARHNALDESYNKFFKID